LPKRSASVAANTDLRDRHTTERGTGCDGIDAPTPVASFEGGVPETESVGRAVDAVYRTGIERFRCTEHPGKLGVKIGRAFRGALVKAELEEQALNHSHADEHNEGSSAELPPLSTSPQPDDRRYCEDQQKDR
jgi:hypothetical protein